MKNLISLFLIVLFIWGCSDRESTDYSNVVTTEADPTLASLYPVGSMWVELQLMETIRNPNPERNFKKSDLFAPDLKTDLYRLWCEDGSCYQLNSSNELELIAREDLETERTSSESLNFFFPIQDGWITVTSMEDENIYTIRHLDKALHTQWTTIYQKSYINTEDELTQFANVLGYNDHVLIFNSSAEEYKKSSYINLHSGNKKQKNEQWLEVLLDSDRKTFLGRLVLLEDAAYSLEIADNRIPLNLSEDEFPHHRLIISDNSVLLALYNKSSGNIRLYCFSYHTGDTLWEQDITGISEISNVILSSFNSKLLAEIDTGDEKLLYVFHISDGNLLGQF